MASYPFPNTSGYSYFPIPQPVFQQQTNARSNPNPLPVVGSQTFLATFPSPQQLVPNALQSSELRVNSSGIPEINFAGYNETNERGFLSSRERDNNSSNQRPNSPSPYMSNNRITQSFSPNLSPSTIILNVNPPIQMPIFQLETSIYLAHIQETIRLQNLYQQILHQPASPSITSTPPMEHPPHANVNTPLPEKNRLGKSVKKHRLRPSQQGERNLWNEEEILTLLRESEVMDPRKSVDWKLLEKKIPNKPKLKIQYKLHYLKLKGITTVEGYLSSKNVESMSFSRNELESSSKISASDSALTKPISPPLPSPENSVQPCTNEASFEFQIPNNLDELPQEISEEDFLKFYQSL